MKILFQIMFLLASMTILGFVKGQADTCPIICLNGECTQGNANWNDHPVDDNGLPLEFLRETNRQGWFCDCSEGFVGIRCARPFEKCGNSGHYCYHGGMCIEGIVMTDQVVCDCGEAVHNGIPYIGKYCEEQCNDPEFMCSNNSGTPSSTPSATPSTGPSEIPSKTPSEAPSTISSLPAPSETPTKIEMTVMSSSSPSLEPTESIASMASHTACFLLNLIISVALVVLLISCSLIDF